MAIVRPSDKPGDDKVLVQPIAPVRTGQRDFTAEARGKVACACFNAALMSPGLAMYATSKDEYLRIVTEAADKAVQYTWKNQQG
jgi:hypothetical protein